MVKKLPEMRKTWLRSLGWEDLLEKMATHSIITAWRIPWTEEPGWLQSMELQKVRYDWLTFFFYNKASKWKLSSWSIIPASDRPTWTDLDRSRIPNLYLEVVLFLPSFPCSLSHPSTHCIHLIYPYIYSRNNHSTLVCWARHFWYREKSQFPLLTVTGETQIDQWL